MLRDVQVEVDTASWEGQPVPPPLGALDGTTKQLDLLRVTSEIARCTAPAIGYGFELNYLWPWLRYAPAFDAGPALRLCDEWKDLDAHQKTILSDDFGMGIPLTLLRDALDLREIVPAQYVIKGLVRLGRLVVGNANTNKVGPAKTPDFLARDAAGVVHVIECKGTQSGTGALRTALERGVEQKWAITLGGEVEGERLAVGVALPGPLGGCPVCRIVDPRREPTIEIPMRKGETEQFAVEAEVAGALQLMGAAQAARESVEGLWTMTARRGIVRMRDHWQKRTDFHNEIVTETRELEFPRPVTDKEKVIRGLRGRIGIMASMLEPFEAAESQQDLDARRERVTRPKAPARRVTEDSYAELSTAGVLVEIEALIE